MPHCITLARHNVSVAHAWDGPCACKHVHVVCDPGSICCRAPVPFRLEVDDMELRARINGQDMEGADVAPRVGGSGDFGCNDRHHLGVGFHNIGGLLELEDSNLSLRGAMVAQLVRGGRRLRKSNEAEQGGRVTGELVVLLGFASLAWTADLTPGHLPPVGRLTATSESGPVLHFIELRSCICRGKVVSCRDGAHVVFSADNDVCIPHARTPWVHAEADEAGIGGQAKVDVISIDFVVSDSPRGDPTFSGGQLDFVGVPTRVKGHGERQRNLF
mmetsp:Transcript_45354/g.126156  ORF Transcript_45354/g.126156 Transcript_45354/m.126156 type:complete len:273 (-) Transcript_45354:398-1216(-)